MQFPSIVRRRREGGIRYPKLPLSEEQAVWLSRLFFLAGPLVSYWMVEVLNSNSPWGFSSLQLALNLVWYYMGEIFFYFVLGNRERAVRAAMFFAWAIGVVNSYAYRFRGRTIFPSDIVTIRTALNVAGNYNYMPGPEELLTLLVMVLFLAAMALLPTPKGRRPFSWKLFVPSQALCLSFLWMFFCTDTVSDAGISPSMWTTRGNGLALNFSLCVRYSWVTPPEGYSAQAVASLAEQYPSDEAAERAASDGETRPVNLIVIMNESFSDLGVLPGVETNRDAMPFLHSLTENTVKGYAYSSVFGGTTANSEYEFLTGNTTAFLPAGTVPYHMYISNHEPGLARQMGDLGYRTVAMHPYYSSGWNRVAVYEDMGFDEQYFLEDFSYTEDDLIREYLSDRADYENLIARYEAKEEGESLFLFNVTMQNHSGYTGEWTNLPREVWLTGEYEGKFDTVDQYLNLVYQSDQALEELISYFSQVEEPTMICLFGDHQPQVDTEFYNAVLGGEVDFLDAAAAQKKQMVPFLIWANYDIPEAQGVELSLNYLSSLLTETANLPQTGYQKYLSDLWEELPIVNTVGYVDHQGRWVHTSGEAELSPAAQSALDGYKQVLYNHIFDKSNRPGGFFTLLTGGD